MSHLFATLLLGPAMTAAWSPLVLNEVEQQWMRAVFPERATGVTINIPPGAKILPRDTYELKAALARHEPKQDMRIAIDDALAVHQLQAAPECSLERLEAERDAMARGAIPFDDKRYRLIDLQLAEAKAHAAARSSPFYSLHLAMELVKRRGTSS
jgi:hypothetical protein